MIMIILMTNMINVLYSVYNDMKRRKTTDQYLNLENDGNVCLMYDNLLIIKMVFDPFY